jgi:hypothetical protein
MPFPTFSLLVPFQLLFVKGWRLCKSSRVTFTYIMSMCPMLGPPFVGGFLQSEKTLHLDYTVPSIKLKCPLPMFFSMLKIQLDHQLNRPHQLVH